jgi:hypothetical protein
MIVDGPALTVGLETVQGPSETIAKYSVEGERIAG